MDNQNNQNNQNNQVPQGGYTNFNNYQTPQGQSQQYQPTQAQPPQYQPPQYQPTQGQIPQYQMPQGQPMQYQIPLAAQQQDNSGTLGIVSLIFSLISVACCPYVFAAVGIICGIIGLTKNAKKVSCWVGIIIGVVSVILNICWALYMAAHPELQQQMLDNLKQIIESAELIVMR